jgi:hypothetical protein
MLVESALNRSEGTDNRNMNIKLVDALLRLPMNICMSYAAKSSNGYGHGKTA